MRLGCSGKRAKGVILINVGVAIQIEVVMSYSMVYYFRDNVDLQAYSEKGGVL